MNIEHWLRLATLLVLIFTVALLFVAWLVWRADRQNREKATRAREMELRGNREFTIWQQASLERALALIESDDEDEVLSGMEVLSALDGPALQLLAMERLAALKQTNNRWIAQPAEATHAKLLNSLSESLNKDAQHVA